MADNLDAGPEHAAGVARAERLHRRLLRREARGKRGGEVTTRVAVLDLAVGEHAAQEPIAFRAPAKLPDA